MATFILVPGATLGSWCWKKVIPLLRNAGHEVYPITLTGLAERAHLMSPAVNMETHIQDITGVLEYEDLTNIIMVGHSAAGTAITGAADRMPERIGHLVYLDAYVPKNGRTALEDNSDEFRAWVYERVIETERGTLFMPPDVKSLGLSDPDVIGWANAKMTPDPFTVWIEPMHLHNEAALARIPKTYIRCIGELPFGQSRRDRTENMDYIEMQTGHMAMLSAPIELVSIFYDIAGHLAQVNS